ncbi:MAG: bifunctional [glutamate--ammonia ligase]-adenylyl-L-tyrosine phosphorylase/[glutamate--ammonia-ligase] adenylyltransferase, partial [Solimonas sp.]
MSDSDLPIRFAGRVPALADTAPRVFAASRFVRETFTRLLDEAAAFDTLARAHAPGALAQAVAALGAVTDEAALARELRRARRAEMARIAFRDIAGLAPLAETLGDLSDLADACIELALQAGERRLQARHGVPRDEAGQVVRPTVLG